MKNYYETLGISEEATQEDIRKSFRELAKKWHPDRNPNNKKESEDKFKEVSEAYDVLSDDTKKSQYDHRRKYGDVPEGFGFGGFDGIGESFFSNFGRRRSRGPDIRIAVELTLKEIVNGCLKKITFNRPSKCSSCNGSGIHGNIVPCTYCSGRGSVVMEQVGQNVVFRTQTTCPECRGSGRDASSRCPNCSNGLADKEEVIEVNFPAGITDQEMIRIQGKGSDSTNDSGDLYIIIRTKPDERFRRNGNDLESNLTISLKKALIGAEVPFEDIDGKTLTVSIPRGCQPDTVLVLQNHGIKEGRLLLKIRVDMPTLSNSDMTKVSSILPD